MGEYIVGLTFIDKDPKGSDAKRARGILFAFAGSILIWAVDFKAASSGAGAGIQSAIFGIYLMFFLFLTMSSVSAGVRAGISTLALLSTVFFIGESSIVGLYNNQPLYSIVVNSIPSLIYGTAAISAYITMEASSANRRLLSSILGLACIVYTVSHFAISLVLHDGIDLANSRYEVLSGAIIPALGLIAVSFVRKPRRLDIVVFLLGLSVAAVSVTRTLFAVLVIQIFAVFISYPTALFRRSTFSFFVIFAGALVLLIGADQLLDFGLADRWVDRVTVSQRMGIDPTALTRKAETRYMLDAFASSPITILFGNGLAATTSLVGRDALVAGIAVGGGSVSFHSVGFGHENHVSLLFIAGLVGSAPLLLLQLLNGFQSFAIIHKLMKRPAHYPDEIVRLGAWNSVIVIGMITEGFFFWHIRRSKYLYLVWPSYWCGYVGRQFYTWRTREIKAASDPTATCKCPVRRRRSDATLANRTPS